MNFSIQRFLKTLSTFPQAIRFIRKHRVWMGFWEYSWVSLILIIVGLLFSLRFYGSFISWWSHIHIGNLSELGSEISHLVGNTFHQSQSVIFSSGFKYFIFIMMEIVIFHSVGKTIEILTGRQDRVPSFRTFIAAQTRMIHISISTWIKELLATIAISIILGILGWTYLKSACVFIVSCYFIGFAMMDNYNERLGMNIRQSLQFTRGFIGIALAIGLVVYIIMLIPVIGSFLGPLIGGVTATIILNQLLQPETNEAYEYEM